MITWRNLRPGMVILHGFTLNGSPLPELLNYPVLTRSMVEQLYTRYKLLRNRQIVVGEVQPGWHPDDISSEIIEKRDRIIQFNTLRDDFKKERIELLEGLDLLPGSSAPLWNTEFVDQDTLIKDNYNSFSYLYGLNNRDLPLPSLFDHMDLILSMEDLLTNRLTNKFSIPDDKDVMLHLVVDCSRSMESGGKLDIALSSLERFQQSIARVMKKTQIQLYGFSNECSPVDQGPSLLRFKEGDTNYSSFMKKVLHLRDRDRHNKVILFTDGIPSDKPEAMKLAALFKKNRVDYTQLVFDVKEDLRTEIAINGEYDQSLVVDNIIKEEDISGNMKDRILNDQELDVKMSEHFKHYTDIAEAAGGNQIIVRINELIKIISVECYDRYMGLLTLNDHQASGPE